MDIGNAALYGLALVIGLCVGSFLNVVIYRLPLQMQAGWRRDSRDFLGLAPEDDNGERFNIAFPASHCTNCRKPLRLWHNIPLFSYLLLRGRCKYCREPISLQYPLVEVAAAAIFVFFVHCYGLSTQAFFAILFSLMLLALTGIDIKTQLLPDSLTYPLLWLGLLVNLNGMFAPLESAVIGALAGYLSLWSVYWLFKLLTGKEGMGHGDFKLLAALGAWLGWQQLPFIILLSSLSGALIGIALVIALGRDRHIPIAFGPYLALGGWIALVWGDAWVARYLGI
ncbi:MAG: A24 family peptidase [Porticoccaceae bacterium]